MNMANSYSLLPALCSLLQYYLPEIGRIGTIDLSMASEGHLPSAMQ